MSAMGRIADTIDEAHDLIDGLRGCVEYSIDSDRLDRLRLLIDELAAAASGA